jgi:integrase
MASVEGRPNATGTSYRVVWRQPVGGVRRRQQLTFPDERQAARFCKLVEGSGNRWPTGWEPVRPGPEKALTFGEWAQRAISRRTRASERTKADYRRDLDRHMQDLLDVPLSEIDDGHVAAWLDDREQDGLADKTIRNLHGLASSIYVDAIRQHPPLATHNPFAGKLGERAAVHTEEMVFLTPQEFALVASHVREEYQPLVRFLYGTGVRYGEATALRVRDVDLLGKRKTVTIHKAWKRTGSAEWEIGEPKTPKARRTLSLSRELVELLIPLVASRRGTELLFAGNAGLRRPHIEVYKRGWAPAVARARVCAEHYAPQLNKRGTPKLLPKPCDCGGVLDTKPRIHDLRHSHVAALIAEGVQLPAISRRLGHSSITITFDRYGHLDPSLDAQVDAAVDKALAPVQ